MREAQLRKLAAISDDITELRTKLIGFKDDIEGLVDTISDLDHEINRLYVTETEEQYNERSRT